MERQLGRWWRRGRRLAGGGAVDLPTTALTEDGGAPFACATTADNLALTGSRQPEPAQPEQPVLLMPSGVRHPIRVGEVLPARRRPWPLSVVRLPSVPRRAVLTAGVCVGLAAPGLVRHLATRVLLGRTAARPEGVLEITRIVYAGPLTSGAAAAIEKALAGGRR